MNVIQMVQLTTVGSTIFLCLPTVPAVAITRRKVKGKRSKKVKSTGMENHSVMAENITLLVETYLYVSRSCL